MIAFLLGLVALPLLCSALPRAQPHVDTAATPDHNPGVLLPVMKRTNLLDKDGVVAPQVLKNQIARLTGKLQRGFNAFEKNTGFAHPSYTQQLSKRATGSDELTDDSGSLWQGTISVGSPAVEYTVDFDTGSSDMFLPGVDCTVNCDGHTLYDTSASTTAQNEDQTFTLTFGDGSTVKGDVFLDTVEIAGLTATDQAVGSATQYSTGFALDDFPPDGLMGMAFPAISQFNANPVFQTLVAQSVTTASIFAFKLATTGSELFLGGVDTTKFTGDFTQNPVTEVGFWQVALDSVDVGGEAVATSLSAIIDTGTTLVLGDATSVAALYAAIPGSKDASSTLGDGFFTVPCASIPDDISLTFGGTSFPISADTFNLGQLATGSEDCVGGIAAADLGDFWVVGDVFLQNVYTSFDVGNEQVGFATLS